MTDDGRSYPDDLPRHSVSAGAAIIREDDRVLVIKRRDNGQWVQPGGIVELDEDPRDTVEREVLEETGLYVTVEDLTGIYKNMVRGVGSLMFRCRILDGEAHATAEATEVAWLTRTQISASLTEASAIRLVDALDHNPPSVRVHDGVNLLRE